MLPCQRSFSLCQAHNRSDCLAWSHTFLILSLKLKLKSPGLTLLVIVSKTDRQLTNHSHPSAETHAQSILQTTKNSFINRKCQNLSNSNSSRNFWHLANNISKNFTSSYFPPLLQPNGSTAVSYFSKTKLFAKTFATNSTLDDTGHIPPTPPPSDYFIPKINILYYDVFQALSGLDSLKAYGPDGVPPVVLKNYASELAPCLVKLFHLCLSTSTYPSSWKFAHIQPVRSKCDHSNPSNYRPIVLIFCLSKALQEDNEASMS